MARSGPRRTILAALTTLVASALLLAGFSGFLARSRPPPPMPGQRISIGAAQLHTVETGVGQQGPTVVLESGLGGGSFAWAWVQPEVSRFARVVSYDRAGLGWSEEGVATHDADDVARQLHSLLERLAAPRPYLLVGHSLGGLFVLRFAKVYSNEVGGIVLVDAVSPDLNGNIDDYDYQHPWRVVAFGDVLVHLGLVSLFGVPPQIDRLPPAARMAANYFIRSPSHWSAMLEETAEFDRSVQEAREAGVLGSVPVIALSATRDRPPGWAELQKGLARLSQRYEGRSFPDTDHYGLVTDSRQAAYTVDAIHDVYERMVQADPRQSVDHRTASN